VSANSRACLAFSSVALANIVAATEAWRAAECRGTLAHLRDSTSDPIDRLGAHHVHVRLARACAARLWAHE
jgi:hypothetical protein